MNLDTFLTQVAGLPRPPRLDALELHLDAGTHTRMDPTEIAGVHPLVVPLARDGEAVLGLLRWPTPPEQMPPPVVRQRGHQLELVATSIDSWLHRELVQRDVRGQELEPLLSAANAPGELHLPGSVQASGLPIQAWLLLKVGVSFDFFAELIELHLEKGDIKAALVTADRACRVAEGWARPLAMRAHLYARLDRMEEARDGARMALLQPWWTMGEDPGPTTMLAGWVKPWTEAPFRRLQAGTERPVLDRAAHLLDAIVVEQAPWESARPELAALYEEAGLPELVRFVDRS